MSEKIWLRLKSIPGIGRIVKTAGVWQKKISGLPFREMKRVKQITVNHCGPACLVMLTSYLGERTSQKGLAKAGRAQKRLAKFGMTPREMARAIRVVSQGKLVFWYKLETTTADLSRLINIYHYPVGVEWQGVFYEDEDEDNGHYGVVTAFDKEKGKLRLADPYGRFAGEDRMFKIEDFVKRWWDINEEGGIGKKQILDRKMSFIVAPKSEKFPLKLKMKRISGV